MTITQIVFFILGIFVGRLIIDFMKLSRTPVTSVMG